MSNFHSSPSHFLPTPNHMSSSTYPDTKESQFQVINGTLFMTINPTPKLINLWSTQKAKHFLHDRIQAPLISHIYNKIFGPPTKSSQYRQPTWIPSLFSTPIENKSFAARSLNQMNSDQNSVKPRQSWKIYKHNFKLHKALTKNNQYSHLSTELNQF